MDDRSLAAALRSGEVRGLAGIYDGYADRLLAYAVLLVPDGAEAAVHDALLVARARSGAMPDDDRLRAWLYALVRNECVRQRRGRVPVGREVLELTGRHELSEAELAAVLGVSARTAARLITGAGAKAPFELAPAGLRERVLGHAEPADHQRRLAERAAPWKADGFPAPLGRPRRVESVWWVAAAVAVIAVLVTTGLALRPDDAPGRLTGASEQLPTSLPIGDEPSPASAAVPAPTPAATTTTRVATRTPERTGGPAPTTTTTSPGVPTAAPAPTTSAAPPTIPPTIPPTPPPPTAPPTTTPPPAPPAVTTRWALVSPACPKSWRARVTATVTGTTATAVSAGFTGGGGVPPRAAMTDAGAGLWTLTLTLPANRRLTWTATATTPDGRIASDAEPLSYTCTR